MSRSPDGPWSLSVLLVLWLTASACTGSGRAEEVEVDARTLKIEQTEMGQLDAPGVDPNTLWTLEVQYLDEGSSILSDRLVEVAFLPGRWRSELAPIHVTPGWRLIRDPGEFGDGAPDLSSALRIAPSWLTMRMTLRVVPLDETEPIAVPAGAEVLRARLVQVCPMKARRMRQFNDRPRGDVIALRTVREERRWWEYQPEGPCREFTPEGPSR